MTSYRQLGPRGLDAYLATHGPAPAAALDAVCAQQDAHTSLLYWFTDLSGALAEAQRARKPVLSLRLLGRLDEELSCANSRFFRKLLYPDPRINQRLREDFVLHWQSVRPVPRVTGASSARSPATACTSCSIRTAARSTPCPACSRPRSSPTSSRVRTRSVAPITASCRECTPAPRALPPRSSRRRRARSLRAGSR
jgi:hypothetical protein